jgi:hypothetical protein
VLEGQLLAVSGVRLCACEDVVDDELVKDVSLALFGQRDVGLRVVGRGACGSPASIAACAQSSARGAVRK